MLDFAFLCFASYQALGKTLCCCFGWIDLCCFVFFIGVCLWKTGKWMNEEEKQGCCVVLRRRRFTKTGFILCLLDRFGWTDPGPKPVQLLWSDPFPCSPTHCSWALCVAQFPLLIYCLNTPLWCLHTPCSLLFCSLIILLSYFFSLDILNIILFFYIIHYRHVQIE